MQTQEKKVPKVEEKTKSKVKLIFKSPNRPKICLNY